MVKVGAKYPATFVDADGDFLSGSNSYKLNLPKGVPAALFWSVTVYDSITASGLNNGQPFPSINTMDQPSANADGAIDIYFGPDSPGDGKSWLRTFGQRLFVPATMDRPRRFRQVEAGDIEKLPDSLSQLFKAGGGSTRLRAVVVHNMPGALCRFLLAVLAPEPPDLAGRSNVRHKMPKAGADGVTRPAGPRRIADVAADRNRHAR
jgi:hypothetical protein